MKNRWLFLSLLAAVGMLLILPAPHQHALAVSGCCKVRSSPKDPWRKQGNDLAYCKKLNRAKDNDNLFARSGLVWWDMNC